MAADQKNQEEYNLIKNLFLWNQVQNVKNAEEQAKNFF